MMFSYKVEVLVVGDDYECHKTFSKVFNSRERALREIKKQNKNDLAYVWVSVMDTAAQRYSRSFFGGKIFKKKTEW